MTLTTLRLMAVRSTAPIAMPVPIAVTVPITGPPAAELKSPPAGVVPLVNRELRDRPGRRLITLGPWQCGADQLAIGRPGVLFPIGGLVGRDGLDGRLIVI